MAQVTYQQRAELRQIFQETISSFLEDYKKDNPCSGKVTVVKGSAYSAMAYEILESCFEAYKDEGLTRDMIKSELIAFHYDDSFKAQGVQVDHD